MLLGMLFKGVWERATVETCVRAGSASVLCLTPPLLAELGRNRVLAAFALVPTLGFRGVIDANFGFLFVNVVKVLIFLLG
mmetsp:Transcript_1040/g.1952  ORF Transcript_1040/g.1952 Transcript_1040/m.1952 type:complete len:80 (+) Transcript_1040:638-877(+)